MAKVRSFVSSSSAKMFAAVSAVSCAAICAAVFVIIGSLTPSTAWAQATASPAPAAGETTASIHGHAQDPLAQPVANTAVEVTTDAKTPLDTFKTDASGDYKGSGIKPGTYTIILFGDIKGKDGKMTKGIIDFQQNVKLTAGTDTQVDFDMTREA